MLGQTTEGRRIAAHQNRLQVRPFCREACFEIVSQHSSICPHASTRDCRFRRKQPLLGLAGDAVSFFGREASRLPADRDGPQRRRAVAARFRNDPGGIVQVAPTYRDVHGINDPPRNTAGSLRHVETDADYIVLCDPDMIVLQSFPLDDLTLGSRQVSFDFVGYLAPDAAVCQPTLDLVCRSAGIDPLRLRNPVVNGGARMSSPQAGKNG
jgi:hypothetical protein